MEDYEQDFEECCPKCEHSPTHYRDCSGLFCDDGHIDESEKDPINFMPDELFTMCHECFGRSIEEWCPKCGFNISKYKAIQKS